MLVNLHHPDLDRAEVKLRDLNTLNPFPARLEYSCPSRGTWTIAHTPMIIPDSFMVYVGASACLRGVVLSVAEYEGMDRYSMVMLEEKDILSGNMEELFIEGITDSLNKIDWRPKLVMPFTGCIHYFLATDLEYVYDELHARFPDIEFINCNMIPTMKENDQTPEEMMRYSMYQAIKRLPENPKSINIIGSNQEVLKSGDHLKLLLDNGYIVRDICDCYDYDSYLQLGESCLNIYSLPVTGFAAGMLEETLGQPYLYMPDTFDYDEIEADVNKLADTLGLAHPDLSASRQAAEEALQKAFSLIGRTPISIDYVASPRYFAMAKLLLSHGFNVTAVYGDVIPADAQPDIDWLKEHYPDLPFRSTVNFRARFYDKGSDAATNTANDGPSEAGNMAYSDTVSALAIGPKAAYFENTKHFVNMIENNGWYGFDGIVRLAEAMIDAFENEKDTEAVIQVKAWGCSA